MLPIAIGFIICSVCLAVLTTGIGHIEFHYAKWTRAGTSMPAITEMFKSTYRLGWILPLSSLSLLVCVVRKSPTNPTVLAWCVSILALAHVAWVSFSALALYLANQTFVVGN